MSSKQIIAAQVFLRSISGRSIKELADGALPEDLSPFRPTEAARNAVHRFLTHAGFTVHADESGLTLSFEGPPRRFARTFGVAESELVGIQAHETVLLRAPEEIRQFVEEIAVLPKPEFF